MELKIISTENKEIGKKKLPVQFKEVIRSDLIKRAVLSIQSNKRQPYGTDPEAGMKASADLSRRRRKYRGSYGHGISRVPRKIISRRGTRFNWVGAVAPGIVGGRKAHPPKAEKILSKKINKKERKKAIRSALAATLDKNLVAERGHKVPANYPIILESKIESISKTKELKKIFESLDLKTEIGRTSKKKVRAGKGKARGRKYRKKTGLLLVVSKTCALEKSAKNILGVNVVLVNKLNAALLAPGTIPGRLTLFTETALDKLEKEKLFM
ncbi:50S ribosomal protein L4 [Candidatus Woesearchaeota archaeon]|nr:50S ribosomal protein L4 [Candidatus Woesearchaeota archaeon]